MGLSIKQVLYGKVGFEDGEAGGVRCMVVAGGHQNPTRVVDHGRGSSKGHWSSFHGCSTGFWRRSMTYSGIFLKYWSFQRYFFRILKLSEIIMEDSRWWWKKVAIFIRSIGRKVPVDWMVKEVRMKSKFDYDLAGFSLAMDHLLLQFHSEADSAVILQDSPWFITRQLLAMEA